MTNHALTTGPAEAPFTPVATAVLGERRRLLQLFAAVRREDGSIDLDRFEQFETVLRAGVEGTPSPHAARSWSGDERRAGERRA